MITRARSYAPLSLVIIFILLISLVGTSACTTTVPAPTPAPTPAPSPVPIPTNTGTVEIRATDAPPTGVSSIMVTTDNIQIHKAGAPEDTWITVVDEEKSFDLVEIQGAEVFLGQETVEAGRYTQIRLDVTKVIVTLEGKEITAKLPSGKLKVVRPWEVEPGGTTILTLDFEADKFVVITGKDRAQVKPVIKLEVAKGEKPLKTPEPAPTTEPASAPTPEPEPAPTQATIEINISDLAFVPETITVAVGTTVTWTNQDSARHTVTSDTTGIFDSGALPRNRSFSHSFAEPGTFDYHCEIHPSMQAKIIVE